MDNIKLDYEPIPSPMIWETQGMSEEEYKESLWYPMQSSWWEEYSQQAGTPGGPQPMTTGIAVEPGTEIERATSDEYHAIVGPGGEHIEPTGDFAIAASSTDIAASSTMVGLILLGLFFIFRR